MDAILQNCRRGKLLSRAEALSLVDAEGEDLQALLATAAELRDRHKGRIVTFSPKIFVPLTNLCRDFCGYCTFRKAPDEPGAKTMTLEEVLRVGAPGKAARLHGSAFQPRRQARSDLSGDETIS